MTPAVLNNLSSFIAHQPVAWAYFCQCVPTAIVTAFVYSQEHGGWRLTVESGETYRFRDWRGNVIAITGQGCSAVFQGAEVIAL